MTDASASPLYPPQYRAGAEDNVLPIVVYVLYLLGFLTAGFTALVGLVMAYALKGGSGPFAASHYAFQIRSFWIGLGWLVLGAFLAVLGVPLLLAFGLGILFFIAAKLIFVVTAIWWGVRSVVGLIRAAQDEPYRDPRTWLV